MKKVRVKPHRPVYPSPARLDMFAFAFHSYLSVGGVIEGLHFSRR